MAKTAEVYANMKSVAVSGVVKSLVKNALSRSFAKIIAENKVKKPKLNTATAGVNALAVKISRGAFLPMEIIAGIKTAGKTIPHAMASGSRYISLRFRLARLKNRISSPPLR
nr:hypothetical protein [uncultured Methanobacterium sp.]